MEKEIKELLENVLARQVIIYKKLDVIEKKMNGTTRLADIQSYADELDREASNVRI